MKTQGVITRKLVSRYISKCIRPLVCIVYHLLHRLGCYCPYSDGPRLSPPLGMNNRRQYTSRPMCIDLSLLDNNAPSCSSLLTPVASSSRYHSLSCRGGRTIQDCQLGYSAYLHPYGLPLANCLDLEEKQSQRCGLPGLFSVPRFLRDRPTYISILCWLVALISSLCGIP